MNKKVFRLILTFTAAISIFTGCRSVPGEKEKINLNGMIYDTDNKPVVNYRIFIDGKGVCTSDIGGRFVIKNISKGEHVFSGFAEDYLSVEEKIVVYDKSQILYIRIPTIESKFQTAFEHVKKEEYAKAEKIIEEVLEGDGENETALYFMSVIEKLKERKERNEE